MARHSYLSIIGAALISLAAVLPAPAKLLSSSLEIDKAKKIVDEIFRQTRLNEGASGWGDRHQQDINLITQSFGAGYYGIFQDMGITNAMARAAAFAKYEPDGQHWIDQMNLFDRAVEELSQKDKAKYYFAKGLLLVQMLPDKLKDLPQDFFKAAENGYPSSFLSDYIAKNSHNVQVAGADTTLVTGTIVKLAQSYQNGGFYQEAYKFYLLALRSGDLNPDYFPPLVECAYNGGSESLAYATAMLFIEIFNGYGGVRDGRANTIRSLGLATGMAAEEIWRACDKGGAIADLITNTSVERPADADSRSYQGELDAFESRYIAPMSNSLGEHDDLFEMAISKRYWGDASVAKRYILRIKGSVESHDGAILSFIQKIHDDNRFTADADIAKWEARRWKAAKKLKEFAEKFPERFKLAGSPR
jgi:tetratricopeptide (TPR) repeat protein